MKTEPIQITDEMLQEQSLVDKAMSKAFKMEAPPMPAFDEMPQLPSYAQKIDDDDLEELAAAARQSLVAKMLRDNRR